jgi:tetratricopeptide (TPR) repeat protein
MMKKIIIFAAFSLIFSSLSGQDIIERISTRICNCIDTIENMDSLQTKLDKCVPEALSIIFDSESDDDNEFADSDSIKNTVNEVMEKLSYYCPKIKEYILAFREAQFYKMSDSDKANEFYEAGIKAYNSDDFKIAEKEYLKAIKADPKFVYAYDNLALTYRKLSQYKKAVKYYGESLKIFPEGKFAIQNQAIAYLYLKDNMNALKNYDRLINLYPGNPEGFFGTAKVLFMNENYEDALDYAFYSHKMYAAQKSDYVRDTEELISSIHDKLKEQGKLEIFNKKAKDHGISINSDIQTK